MMGEYDVWLLIWSIMQDNWYIEICDLDHSLPTVPDSMYSHNIYNMLVSIASHIIYLLQSLLFHVVL